MQKAKIIKLVKAALAEDIGKGDFTSKYTIAKKQQAEFSLLAKDNLILCGIDFFTEAFKVLDKNIQLTFFFAEGAKIAKGQIIAKGMGNARAILAAERVALNLMQYMSGIATNTNLFVEKIKAYPVKILDTRKILPFYRETAKYAVLIGGGENHRMSLDKQILIKDNHIIAAKSIANALKNSAAAKLKIEIECETLEQVREALKFNPDIIMLDNMSISNLRKAVKIINKKTKIEASGNINLANVAKVAATGVDYISVGSLTHSVKASDLSLNLKII
ncbi:MAG: carboxylating nicotinate-nucleotide diphosphorylase [Rickettsiales bacterium]